jgi:hypothetical protein
VGPPHIFVLLMKSGAVTAEALAPLLALLPEERYVQTSARGGEAFDSTRWPLRVDAELMRLAAGRMPFDPRLSAALDELDATTGHEPLRTLSDQTIIRLLMAMGIPKDVIPSWYRSRARGDVLDQAPWPEPLAQVMHAAAYAKYTAADGLWAYELHRGMRLAAKTIAEGLEVALRAGALTASELIEAAIASVKLTGR